MRRVEVMAAGFADLLTTPIPLTPGETFDVGALRLEPVALSVFVAYADSVRASSAFPVPWEGSANALFLGGGSVFDAGAIRLDNATGEPIDVDRVTVDLERPGPVFDLWGSFTVPAGGSVILTQTQRFNFDTSDFPLAGCDGLLAPGDPRVPKVTVTVDGVATDYFDTGHILDTGGVDLAACSGNESLAWRLIGTTGIGGQGDFLLAPPSGRATLGSPYTLEAELTDANGQAVPGVEVAFRVTDGPNRGETGTATTDGSGRASFSYESSFSGTDTWQASVQNASGGALTSNPATVTWPSLPGLEVFVGYADNVRPNASFPNPWQGSPGIVYLGSTGQIDAGAMRLDNTTDEPLAVDRVTVDLQRPGPQFDLWGSFTIPAHGSAILTQTRQFNFDTSELTLVGCGRELPPGDPRIPKITVTAGGLTSSYLDTSHILDTFGFDLACLRNESLQWRPVGEGGAVAAGALALAPAVSSRPVGTSQTLLAVATDAAGEPLANLTVDFRVLSGPDAGTVGQAVTGAAGTAAFPYTGNAAGTDSVRASITNASGGRLDSNLASVRWLPRVTLALAPATRVQPVGTPYNATLTATDGTGQPVADLAVRFTVVSGPNAGLTGSGTTDIAGQVLFASTSRLAGTDTLEAAVTGAAGATVTSNRVSVEWTAVVSVTLAPPVSTLPLGSPYTATATVTDGSSPLPGVPVRFEVLAGPNGGTTGEATTDAAGHAAITYTSSTLGTDTLQATASPGSTGGTSSNRVSAAWVRIPTRVTYTGPSTGEYSDPLTLTARLTEAASGAPVAGETLNFLLGEETATGTTDASGVATVVLTPQGTPGETPLTVTFAGAGPYAPSAAATAVAVRRDETVLHYTGKTVVAAGTAQAVSALLTDGEEGEPLAGRTVIFRLGTASASAVTDEAGRAVAALALPPDVATGPAELDVEFAGDTFRLPSTAKAPVVLYEPTSFVVWGGNPRPPVVGESLPFWGSRWARQVVGGDYRAHSDFKGFAQTAAGFGLCEPDATTTGPPPLDASCWSTKPGQSFPPARIGDYIGVLVSTAIAEAKGRIYGNIAATVVLRIDPEDPYRPDPGHPASGTVVDVIEDGAGLFPALAYTGPGLLGAGADNTVRAHLVAAVGRTPLAGETLTFTLGSTSVTGVTDASGTAEAELTLPPQAAGESELEVAFFGDGDEPPAHVSVPVLVGEAIAELSGTAPPPLLAARPETSAEGSAGLLPSIPRPVAEVASFGVPGLEASFGLDEMPTGWAEIREPGGAIASDGNASAPSAAPSRLRSSSTTTAIASALAAGNRRYFFYSQDMHLVAESDLTAAPHPGIAEEYIWFNGHPVAQVDAAGEVRWTFTDHLGTPILQTSAPQGIAWRAEYEPYGQVFALRAGDVHQPLRFPGQEAEQLNLGANGVSGREYNVYRWYSPTSGMYTTPDPMGALRDDVLARNLYSVVNGNPLSFLDPFGLDAITDDEHIQDCAYCLFSLASFGNRPAFERQMLVFCDESGKSCMILPASGPSQSTSNASTHATIQLPEAKWKKLCALIHTHPRGNTTRADDPGDKATATRLSRKHEVDVPIYVIHPTGGISKWDPATPEIPSQRVEKPNWVKGPKSRCKKPCDGIHVP